MKQSEPKLILNSNLVAVVVVERTDLHPSHQVSLLMVVLAAALVEGLAEPALEVGQQILGLELVLSLSDFLSEVSLL